MNMASHAFCVRCGVMLAAVVLPLTTTSAAVVSVSYWPLGESGSVSETGFQTPLVDTVGGHNVTAFQTAGTNTASIVTPGAGGAPGSTEALSLQSTSTGSGWFGNTIPFNLTDDWAMQVWVKPLESLAGNKVLLQSNNGTNGLSVILNASNVFSIAGGGGGVQNITASEITAANNAWHQLTLIRYAGENYLYVGNVQAATGNDTNDSSYTTLDQPMFAFGQNGTNGGLDAVYDAMAVWTFDSDTDSLADVVAVVAVPEPGSLLWVAAGGSLALLGRRWTRQRR